MAKALLALLLVAALSLYFHHGQAFDYWTLSLAWLPTVCMGDTEYCPTNACSRPAIPIQFVIDGLWATYKGGVIATDCHCIRFNPNEIDPNNLGLLQTQWPALNCKNYTLCHGEISGVNWAHEWEKYGTCGFPTINNQDEYFTSALFVTAVFDLGKSLSRVGFPPSDTAEYQTSELLAAIKNIVGTTPSIHCDNNNLKSVHICLQLEGKEKFDCQASSCPKTVKIPLYGSLVTEHGIAEATW